MNAELEERDMEGGGRSLLGRAFRIVLGLFLSLILGIGLGVTAYLTLPYLYRDLTEPAADNASRINSLERDLQDARAEAEAAQQTGRDRLSELDRQLVEQAEALADLEAQLEELALEQPNQTRFTRALSALENRVDAQGESLEDLQGRLSDMESTLAEDLTPRNRMQRDLLLTRAMVSVVRARLWLLENNLGSATLEVEAAQDLISEVIATASGEDLPSMLAVADRLELTLVELDTAPLVAADDLEVVWKLLGAAMASEPPAVQLEATATPTPTPSP